MVFIVYIGPEEISLVEAKYPEIGDAADAYQKYIQAWDTIKYSRRNWYEEAYGFWGGMPYDFRSMWPRIRSMNARMLRIRGIDDTHDAQPPARCGIARYVDRLYDEGKTAQEIALILQGNRFSRQQIGVLLREGDDIIGDYGKWLDGKGWLKNPKK